MQLPDTSAAANKRYTELLRRQQPHERLAQAIALCRNVRELTLAGIRLAHPDAQADELRVRMAVRLYGRQAAKHLFGNVPADAV